MTSWEVCRAPHPDLDGINCHFGKGHERVLDIDANDSGGQEWDHGDPERDHWWDTGEDWATDETMSREETLARFEALNPEATDEEVLTVARRNRNRWRGVLEILAKR